MRYAVRFIVVWGVCFVLWEREMGYGMRWDTSWLCASHQWVADVRYGVRGCDSAVWDMRYNYYAVEVGGGICVLRFQIRGVRYRI